MRETMVRIAADETRHAAFSWQLMAWIAPQLSLSERAQAEATRARAERELEADLAHTLPERERRALGLPTPKVARAVRAHVERGAAPVYVAVNTSDLPQAQR